MHLRKFVLVVLSCLSLVCVAAGRQANGRAPLPLYYENVKIPHFDISPTLEDFSTMAPDPRVAGKMLHITDFIQRNPDDGAHASEKTDVYIGSDTKRLYVVWVCWDDQPYLVRAHMASREDIWGDDTVEVLLDTFHDERRGYAFATNPVGVQWDATYTEGGGSDSSFDTVWDSRGIVTPHGYVVWIAIPYWTLRFPAAGNPPWGLVLIRNIPRRNENDYWPRVSSQRSGILSQEGTISRPAALASVRNLQITPYLLAGGHRAISTEDPSSPEWNKAFTATGGFEGKAIVKDRLVFDVTVNPDFSQVPVEDPQVTANQRYEVYYPELRPFFLENANYFTTPFNLVFTRRIEAPVVGARLTSKLNHWAVGVLSVEDKGPGETVAPTDPSYHQLARWNVLRLSRDLGKQSSLGVLYTQHSFAGESNQVGGMDGQFMINANWFAGFQAVESSITAAGGTSIQSPTFTGSFSRSGRSLNLGGGYTDIGRNFEDDLGYIPRVDVRQSSGWISYRFHPQNGEGVLQNWGPGISYLDHYDHTGLLLDRNLHADVRWTFEGQRSFGWRINKGEEQLRPQDFSSLIGDHLYPTSSTGVWFNFGYWSRLSLGSSYNWLQRTNYYPRVGIPFSGSGNNGNLWVTIRPSKNLRIDNTYAIDMMHTLDDVSVLENAHQPLSPSRAIYQNHIIESKWNLQLSPALSVRFIADYDAVLANHSLSSLQTTKQVTANFLLSYTIHPGTAVYVGYNSDLQNLDPALTVDSNQDIVRTPNELVNDGRQFFIKLAYLFHF